MTSAELAEVVTGGVKATLATARVIAFPGTTPGADLRSACRFSMRDRIVAHEWARNAGGLGYTRVVFEAPSPDSEAGAGEFLLIYANGTAWASWGIGCGPDGMTLWHSARGTTIGRFESLQEALAAVQAATVSRLG